MTLRVSLRIHGRLVALAFLGVGGWTAYAAAGVPPPDEAARSAFGALALGSFVVTLALLSSLVAEEIRSGTWLLWMQTGVPPLGLYLRRFAVQTALALAATLGLTAVAAAVLGVFGAGPGALLARVPGLCLAVALQSVLVWACSGWGIRSDSATAFVLFCLLTALEVGVNLRPEGFGVLAPLADLVGLPLDDMASVSRDAAGLPTLRVVAWAAAWAAVGSLGIVRATRPREGPHPPPPV